MGTAIIAHGYAAPVFQSSKHILYLVTLTIQLFVVIILTSCIFFELECRACSSGFSNACESMTHHSPCRQEELKLKVNRAASMPHQRNH